MSERFRVIETDAGWVGIVATARGLRRVLLPAATAAAARAAVRRWCRGATEDAGLMPRLATDLVRYFRGEPVEFAVKFDWSGGEFETRVWRACARIPYGRTGTYKSLAERVGRADAARAVGRAMGHNPCPIVVPCHRVLRSDGGLGGYSGPGGVAFKQRLLNMESAAR
jgi:O-6-methylguanine DNA methyltransferase